MIPLDLFNEPFARTGNIAAEGFRKLLGRPALGLLQTVVREALQNSLDASIGECVTEVSLRTRLFEGEELRYLREVIFASRPDAHDSTGLGSVLAQQRIRVFEISDFNTSGLGGPTRADIPAQDGDELDFVNFFRNVGAPRDTPQGGGTYGYGKTSLYALSECATIIVDTQATCNGDPVRRIMGCHLGEAYEADSGNGPKRYTGRHWWGRSDGGGGVDPVVGDEAIHVAERLGLPPRNPDRTGTTVIVIAPQVEEDLELDLDLVEAVLWNFWPRMCRSTSDRKRLSVRIHVDGDVIAVPDPEDFPPLDLFASALTGIRNDEGVEPVLCGRPIARLGDLVTRKGLRADRHVAVLRESSSIPHQCSHIALMRPVELVVKYLEGEPFQDERFEWAGVFVCSDDDDVERAFADAEPPAHDDWIPDMLPKGHARTFVKVALKRLAETAQTYARPLSPLRPKGEQGPSLASTATLMGQMLDASPGQAPGRARGDSRGAPPRKPIAISRPLFSHLEMMDGAKVAVFEAELANDGSHPDLRIRAEPYLVMDGGRASVDDVPLDFSGQVISISLGESTEQGNVLAAGGASGPVTIRVPISSEAALGLKLVLDNGDQA